MTSVGGKVTGHGGLSATLRCEATGDPPLNMHWTKDGHPLKSSSRISIQTSHTQNTPATSVVLLSSLVSSDAGEYRCSANNDHSSDVTIYNLIVLGKQRCSF